MNVRNDGVSRRELLAAVAGAGLARGAESRAAPRISYYRNGEVRISEIGKAEGKALTTGHWDFKPTWSNAGGHLVFFRRYKNDPVTVNWLSAICIMNTDGSEFHQLTDASVANFNPTWTRDGKNTPIWNRRNPKTGAFSVVQGRIGGKPGEETSVTPPDFHTWVYSSLMDGRLLVSSRHPSQGWGYYLLTRRGGGEPLFERLECPLAAKGLLDRVSVSPSERKVCFEFQTGFKYKDPGRTLYMADFDARRRVIDNVQPIANQDGKPFWYAYPRWIEGEAAIVYHMMGPSGKGQLYVYRLSDGSNTRVSPDQGVDYRYPHGEAAPC